MKKRGKRIIKKKVIKKEIRKKILLATSILFIIIIIALISLRIINLTGKAIIEQEKKVNFYFYDENKNCPLNGYILVNNKVIGKTTNGIFNLTYGNYIENIKNNQENSEIEIFGILGDCFNSELYFNKYYEIPRLNKYNFLGETKINQKSEINKNNPSKKEFIGFINPNSQDIKSELNKITLTQNKLSDLTKINNYLNNKINYLEDWEFNQTNYWQTPKETLSLKTGDCEDYSTTLLSLFLAYENSLNCYNIIFTSHVTTLCYIENNYIYYDQDKVEIKKRIDKTNYNNALSGLNTFNKYYFNEYGLEKNTIPYYAYNNKEYIEFNDEDTYIEWMYSLDGKQKIDLFEDLEKQLEENLNNLTSIELKGELRTEQIALPSLKTSENFPYLTLSILVIILITLIIGFIIFLKKGKREKIINELKKEIEQPKEEPKKLYSSQV